MIAQGQSKQYPLWQFNTDYVFPETGMVLEYVSLLTLT